MACAVTGCLVSGPPDYQDPSQTPPVLDLNKARPSVLEVQSVKQGDSIDFNVPVRSEDRGVNLIAGLYVDYGSTYQFGTEPPPVPASTYADTNRQIVFTWTVNNVTAGCHRLTLLVTHEPNLILTNLQPPVIRDPNDLALANWWMNVDDSPAGSNTLADCPPISNGGGS